MKELTKTLVIILTFFLFSCSNNDNTNSVKVNLLTKKVWKKEYYENYSYDNDVLKNIKIDNTNAGTEKLTFNINSNVIYELPTYITPITGVWSLDINEQFLSTILKVQIPSSTGFGSAYLFPHSKIIELTNDKLVLESDTEYYTLYNSSVTINSKIFTRFHFIH